VSTALAPLFRRVPLSKVSGAYHAWAEHYNDCAFCQRDDWKDPHPGEPDYCDKGRSLFLTWVRSARVNPPPIGVRARVEY